MDQRLTKITKDKRFDKYLVENDLFLVDTYNQSFFTDICPTIKQRIDQNNNIRIVERLDDSENNDLLNNVIGGGDFYNPSHSCNIVEVHPLNTDKDGCCSCLKAGYYKMGVANFIKHTKDGFKATCVMEIDLTARKCHILGNIYGFKMGSSFAGYIYDVDHIGPTLMNMLGGNRQPLIMEEKKEHILEPSVLRSERTEFGKSVRKSVESGEIKISRHQMTDLQPRKDGISNTLTGVQKDNLVMEPHCVGYTRDSNGDVVKRHLQDYANTVHSSTGHGGNTDCFVAEPRNLPAFRIRKLTPRECFRLMGVTDSNVDTIQQAGISNCQQYKMAGNSIVVDVLENIFRKLFVDKESDDAQLCLF